tara:strand:- start:56 stop:703 length:648 start_codon:yes stop_codon:yes gene_type:complete
LDDFTKKISEILNSGKLVDDQIVIDIVKQLKENPDTFLGGEYKNSSGLILDGVPRTVRQAEMLSEFSKIDLIINFTNRDEIVIQKLGGRRVCPNCNKNFNIADVNTEDGYQMSPLLPSHGNPLLCDGLDCCDISLITREDDKEHIIMERLDLYKNETLPILDFYKSNTSTPVIDFEAKKGKKDYPHVKEMLLEHLSESIIPEGFENILSLKLKGE